jgi:cation diffusion facilitator family transporter
MAELVLGVWQHILVLLSDGFHNLSDVVALGIALWASKKAKQSKSMQYSYGFARTELLGALVNGCFLLSLAFYVLLEAIPRYDILKSQPFSLIVFFSKRVGCYFFGFGRLCFFMFFPVYYSGSARGWT